TRPFRRRLPAPRNTDEIDARIRRALCLAIVHEGDRKTRSFDYWAKCFRGRAGVVLQKNDHAARFKKTADGTEQSPVQLPVGIVIAQLVGRSVGEMRRIADDEIPLLCCGDIVEIIGAINGDAAAELVGCNSAPARFDRFRIDIGDTKRVAKSVAKERKANERRPGAPFEYARLTWRSAIAQERKVIEPAGPSASVEVIFVIPRETAVVHGAPALEPAQPGLDEAPFDKLQRLDHCIVLYLPLPMQIVSNAGLN